MRRRVDSPALIARGDAHCALEAYAAVGILAGRRKAELAKFLVGLRRGVAAALQCRRRCRRIVQADAIRALQRRGRDGAGNLLELRFDVAFGLADDE